MIDREPEISVALIQKYNEARVFLTGRFFLPGGKTLEGCIQVRADSGLLLLEDSSGNEIIREKEILLTPEAEAFFTVSDVKIGIDFHWQRTQEQSFRGKLLVSACSDSAFNLINKILLEDYLESVISSEMSAKAPLEFLKAQAITARSWLMTMLAKKKAVKTPAQIKTENEIVAWQDINDHEGFDVCADDHCQRYQGITRIISENVHKAIEETRGLFLVYDGEICDARYYKCCGGQTEIFATAWEDKNYDYLSNVSDDVEPRSPVRSESEALRWLSGRPPAYCNTRDRDLLKNILPAFDQETPDFYRWQVVYERKELEEIIRKKSGIDFGDLRSIESLERGPSGRISRLKIEGTKKTMIVGKELEIRRWLSPSHLLSSAFVVSVERNADGDISRFIFTGGGWGHGVGLCQIGAAVMASQGFKTEEILAHYFTGAQIKKLY
ncbi:MAG: SpoIID/LytB domain-containing protein [Deltaproteobacteria bacterium]|nr:SpoIID/LytB domain-containing protein [Deltaproteobacteria bacterium]